MFTEDEDDIECNYGSCEAPRNTTGITSCIHCGGELIEVDGCWYHWTSFENGKLIDGAKIQDFVKRDF